MRVLIVFRAMFGLLALMVIIVEAQAICQTEYNGVLIPCDIMQRWHQRRENYYKLERMFVIKRNHPGEQYSSLKLFWPEDAAPYFNRDRITYYKCINRTPTIAKTLMHIIRGGTGTPELVVDVMYTPVRYRLMNRMIITCHIFTARDDSLGNMQKQQPWNQFDIERPNYENEPVGDEWTMANSTLGTTAISLGTTHFTQRTSTVASKSTTRKATTLKPTTLKAKTKKAKTKKVKQPAKPQSKGKGKKIKKTTPIGITTLKISEKSLPGKETRQDISTASFYTMKPTRKTSNKNSSVLRNMILVTTTPKTKTSNKRVKSPKVGNTTRKIKENCSKSDKTLCGDTNSKKKRPKSKATTTEVTSRKTVEVTSQMSTTTSVLDLVRELQKIFCGGVNPASNDTQDSKNDKISSSEASKIPTSKTVEVTTKKIERQTSEDENVKKSLKLEDDIQKPSTSALYNLVAKTAQRKFGLAKISYR